MSGDNIGSLVGKIYDLVKDLNPDDISRVFRAVSALFGGKVPTPVIGDSNNPITPGHATSDPAIAGPTNSNSMDIKSFIQTKNPKNDVQLAATIAYYYSFEAPHNQKKDSINSTDLTEAIRLANKKRPPRPSQVLTNAKNMGLLDNAGDRGHFKINSVGENLVAMVLPGNGTKNSSIKRKKSRKSDGKSTKTNQKK